MGWRSMGCIAACGVACCVGLGVVRACVQLGCRVARRGGSVRASSGDSRVVRGRSEPWARVGVLGVGGVAVGIGGRAEGRWVMWWMGGGEVEVWLVVRWRVEGKGVACASIGVPRARVACCSLGLGGGLRLSGLRLGGGSTGWWLVPCGRRA